MKNVLFRSIMFSLLYLMCLGVPDGMRAGGTLQGLTELQFWDITRAYNGYTLFAARGKTDLIDMYGRVVHSWNLGTNPHLLDDGHLLDAATDDPSGFKGFTELDWSGNKVWEYRETRSDYAPHHDFLRIYNPKLQAYTTLYIANKSISNDEAIAAGCDPANAPYTGAQMDAVVEVDMSGTIVWEWRFFDHVVQDIDPSKDNYVGDGKTIADYPGRIDLNMPGKPLKRDWLHCNGMDYSEELDQVVINSVQGEFYVIDHGNTFLVGDSAGSIALAAGPAGDFLYRFGDPARYEQGEPPSITEDWTESTTGHKQMGGTHHVQWIKAGLPGEGHFLVFNNSQYLFEHTPQSSILEIDGFLDSQGIHTSQYVNPPEAGYTTVEYAAVTQKSPRLISNQIVWSYSSSNNRAFFSHIGSSGQRLPNGNTLICSDTEGHFFEVTAAGRLVWEYINPATSKGVVTVFQDNLPMTSSVFRATRFGPDHPALAGRDLTPGDTLTGSLPPDRPPVVWGLTLESGSKTTKE